MKGKISLLVILLFGLTILFNNLYAVTDDVESVVVTYDIGTPGTYYWNGAIDKTCRCYRNNGDCKMQVKITKKGNVEKKEMVSGEKLYTLTGHIDNVAMHVKNADIEFEKETSGGLHTFPDGSTLNIISCEKLPELNGRIINISQLSTDEDGNFVLSFK